MDLIAREQETLPLAEVASPEVAVYTGELSVWQCS